MSAFLDPREIYDLLLDYAIARTPVNRATLGLVWTLVESDNAAGLAMSPGGEALRTLNWPGTLVGRPLPELARWVKEWDPFQAALGMAACNAAINTRRCLPPGEILEPRQDGDNNLAVFRHFLPELTGKRVVVVGRYPGLDRFAAAHGLDLTVLERRPGPNDLPDAACEYLLPQAEWVFLTASSIPNKTFPRLMELSRDATVVLMGPTVPWLAEFHHFGVDYLAGVEIADRAAPGQIVAEGGGTRLFDGAVRYRVAPLTPAATWDWLRRQIAFTAAEKEQLNREMEDWYAAHSCTQRFPRLAEREAIGQKLSRLDSCAHELWSREPPPGVACLAGTALPVTVAAG
ncbi:MAG TPA: DUF364 domain-containing protein [Methylococcaceae bacterium]|nr:DUF364 domain-containing protein [Methylococcaceae bacterium]